MVTDAIEAVERLLPRAKDLAGRLVPEAQWAYTRVGPISCEMKGDPGSYQYAHRFALSAEEAPGGALPSHEELRAQATDWLAAEGFELVAQPVDQPENVLFLTASGEHGRVTIAAGPEAILVSVATHPLSGSESLETAAGREN